jgi:hypothetical protein
MRTRVCATGGTFQYTPETPFCATSGYASWGTAQPLVPRVNSARTRHGNATTTPWECDPRIAVPRVALSCTTPAKMYTAVYDARHAPERQECLRAAALASPDQQLPQFRLEQQATKCPLCAIHKETKTIRHPQMNIGI